MVIIPKSTCWLPRDMRRKGLGLRSSQDSGKSKGCVPKAQDKGFALYGSLHRTNPKGYAQWCKKYDGVQRPKRSSA